MQQEAPAGEPLGHDLLAAAERIALRLNPIPHGQGHAYTWDLALEAMLGLSAATGEDRWRACVEKDIARRGWTPTTRVPWPLEPFCSLTWAWAQATGDARIADNYVVETRAMVRELPRTADGLVTHPRGESRGGGHAILSHVDQTGVIHGVCPGPGPIEAEEPWRIPSFKPGDPHGPGAVLEALASALAHSS